MTFALEAKGLAKWYPPRPSPAQQFWDALTSQSRAAGHSQGKQGSSAIGSGQLAPEGSVVALHPISFNLAAGKVLGIVGKNGAGKSTLLQLLSGTLEPSAGDKHVSGRIAALLELGAGFNPEFTGIENIHLNAALLGMSGSEVKRRLTDILDFADIGSFAYRPVKTYSSGMFVRLAFAVAVCVQPEILIIDEALSVGDGEFARKSFKRIMDLKDAGTTILFCSHSLYQVEALCDQVLWLDRGTLQMEGAPGDVIAAYAQFLETGQATAHPSRLWMPQSVENLLTESDVVRPTPQTPHESLPDTAQERSLTSLARILRVKAWLGKNELDFSKESDRRLLLQGDKRSLAIEIFFQAALRGPPDRGALSAETQWERPTLAVTFTTAAGQCLTAVSTLGHLEVIAMSEQGRGCTRLVLDDLPLRRGIFRVDVLLGCERGLHLYDQGIGVLTIDARAEAAEQGLIVIAHRWERPTAAPTL